HAVKSRLTIKKFQKTSTDILRVTTAPLSSSKAARFKLFGTRGPYGNGRLHLLLGGLSRLPFVNHDRVTITGTKYGYKNCSIEQGNDMGTILFECPITGRPVSTGIETEPI